MVKLFTVKETAGLLNVSIDLVYQLVACRKIRHERIGLGRGRIRIPEDALDEFRARATIGPIQEASEKSLARIGPLKHLKIS